MTMTGTAGPLRAANRDRRRLTALGVDPDAGDAAPPLVCVLCGETRLFTLHARDGHHVAGRVNDHELTAVVCLNCHADQTERHRRVGVRLRDDPAVPPTLLDRLAEMLAGASVFLLDLGSRLGDWAIYLRAVVTTLDDQQPGWRDTVGSIPGPVGVTAPGLVPGFPVSELGVSEDGDPHDL